MGKPWDVLRGPSPLRAGSWQSSNTAYVTWAYHGIRPGDGACVRLAVGSVSCEAVFNKAGLRELAEFLNELADQL